MDENIKKILDTDLAKNNELDDDELEAVAGGDACICAVGGGGTGSDNKTCACIMGGAGLYNNDLVRCGCFYIGSGSD